MTKVFVSSSTPTGYSPISHSLNNCLKAPFGYLFLKSSLSSSSTSCEALAESLAESQAEALAESQAESLAESLAEALAESQAESQAESLAEALAESQAESQAESLAESQSFSDVILLYSTDALIPKHSRVNRACFSTSSFFKSLLGLNHGTFGSLSMK